LYKSYANQSGLKGAEIVTEIALLPIGEINVHETGVTTEETIADPIAVEQPSQEEWWGVTHRISLTSELAKINFEALNLAVVTDNFDADMFDENIDTEKHVEKDDEIVRSEGVEGNMQHLIDTTPDGPVDTSGESNEANVSELIPPRLASLAHLFTSSYLAL
jgi:hypothetical protein